jgi:hypothetical protein
MLARDLFASILKRCPDPVGGALYREMAERWRLRVDRKKKLNLF